ncbi:MAG: putative lipid II flippase MurJ [Chlamydiae bacterium]|nr:putative lipid II flippase MurJ [Chlamydiota bacterium]
MDSTKSILSSARRFFSGTLLSRITGMLRDISMAFAFGTGESVAAFFIAFRLAHLLRRLLGEGALQSAFIPKFEELRSDNPERACRFFCDLYGLLTLVLVGIIAFAALTLGGVLKIFEINPSNREIITLSLLLTPSLLFICLYGLNASILQCEKCYFLPSVAPAAFNVVWIIGALILCWTQPESPMIWLSYFVAIACFCQWLITLPKTMKILYQHGIFQPWRRFDILSKDLALLAKPLFLGFVGVAAGQINNALDPLFARYASSEGPALLWYAIRIQQLPLALFGIALSGALLPPLTRALKAGDHSRYHAYLRFSIRQCLWIMIPMTLALFFFGKQGIQWIYCRGHFTEQSVTGTAQCLWAYSWGLLPMSLVLLLAPAYYAQGNYAVPAGASLISMILNVSLNSLMVIGLGLGPASVALATSISSWVNLVLLAALFKRSYASTPVPLADERL